ncbi:exopolysaccharide biosynthesis protein [Litoreibacter meonggei]|uniref:exopolysaccharide biosynthesis protein n=1 Tax=Litoreibacter meonggei TaxID=1049199 RepID=UPI001FE3264C|nr:exopolysaccharide biosynthesis protein [Litoreibacter meonggei]
MDSIVEAAEDKQIGIRDLVQSVGQASFSPVLLVPAIAVATPLSGIPMFSSLMGLLIFFVALQMLLRRDHLWLPEWLLSRKADGMRVRSAFERLRPILSWLDDHTQARLEAFAHRPLIFVPQILCVLSGLIMPFLEFVPFSSSLIGIAVSLLAFGMLARDGLFVMLGLVPYVGAAWLIIRVT